jgi:protein-S-isoprenylcysteine O-methyltransferase Ste14
MSSLAALPIEDIFEHLWSAVYWPLPLALWPIPTAVPFWAIFLWARSRERQILSQSQPINDSAANFDKGSWPIINHGWKLVRLAAVVAAFITPPVAEGAPRDALFLFSLALMIGGALLRQHCLKMLGDHFTYDVRVSEKSQIIKRGIYKWVRHPSYTGGMLFNLGLGLALTNWNSVVFIVAGMAVMYVYRVHVEEQALLQIHRGSYREYMQHTKRFVPFLF